MRSILSGSSLPTIEGINITHRNRDAWDTDQSTSYLKYSLCQIESDWQAALAERFRKDKMIAKGSIPDVWKPLRDMTENLLPHSTRSIFRI